MCVLGSRTLNEYDDDDDDDGVPEMVTPAMKTTAVLLGFLNLTICHVQFCHDSGLASDMPCSV